MIFRRHHLKSATQQVTIAPIGDLQWAGDEEDLAYDSLVEHLRICLDAPTPLFVGMGDYVDFASPSNREALESSRLYDTAKKVIANATKGLVDDLYGRLLKPTRGKWLGLGQGHHHHQCSIGQNKRGEDISLDSDVYLAKLLDAPFLDEFGFLKLMFPGGGSFGIVTFHGSGSSVFPWGPLAKMFRLVPHFHADLFLMGHQTKKAMGEIDRLVAPDTGTEFKYMTIKMVGTGGWTKGYVSGRRTYISQAALGPVALGQPLIHLRPRFRGKTWDAGMTVEL